MGNSEHDDLGARIKAAQNARKGTTENTAKSPANAGNAVLQHGSELFANVIVGLGLGLAIDYFLGTRPWGTLIMLVLGLAAGFFGVIRAYKQINSQVAESTEQEVES